MAINPIIKQKAEDIRSKIFGSEVRESLASGLEGMSEDVESIKGRQNTVESTFQSVIEETTGKDVISAPEIIAARGGHDNLSQRLLSTEQQLLQNKEEATVVVSTTEPKTGSLWYQDKGATPDFIGDGSGMVVTNAQVSDDAPSDTDKLWFDL